MIFENLIARIAGKAIAKKIDLKEGQVDTKKWYQSKTIWTAVVTGIVGIVQAVGTATGHNINIPTWVYDVLGAVGLYSLRTGDKPIQ
jgi:hypothetical protein